MSESQETEMLLAREAQLVYSNVTGWSMSGGSLRTWRGKIDNIEYEVFLPRLFPKVPPVVRALVPVQHPDITPEDGRVRLKILENWRPEYHLYQVILQLISLLKRHPARVSGSGSFFSKPTSPYPNTSQSYPVNSTPRTFSQTQSSRPIFQRTTSRPMVRATQEKGAGTPITAEIAVLKKELDRLKDELTKRDEELTHIRAKEAIGAGTEPKVTAFKHIKTDDQLADIEAEQIAISELMANLDERHVTGEISTLEYSKLYKKYARDLFILNKKREYALQQQKRK